MLKAYYRLTKPGIIYGNTLTAAAGFLLASHGDVHFVRLLAVLTGTVLVIASACVFNNYIDRGIDAKMSRTKKRALVSGKITGPQALMYAGVLGVAGFAILATGTNALTLCIGIVGFIDYVVFYTWAKRHTMLAALVGSISGATPIAAGYTAVSNTFDAGALLVFIVLVLWQMPHFYAIAMFRQDDYAAARIPVLPIVQGIRRTKIQILLYIAAFAAAVTALTVYNITGYTFLAVMCLLTGVWFWRGLQGFAAMDDKRWARKMFLFSLIIILALSVLLSVDTCLP
ncbi:MAG TPA: heme o synthase [Candidatus Saccharimonadales bacterium]|nr:heme o synthase [Candidatus Saccharimonadales bacterium]